MDNLTDESKLIIVQFFLDDPTSETPRIHSKKREKRKGTVLKELDTLIHDLEEIETDIDLEPYKEAAKILRKIRGKDEYMSFVDELLQPYVS
ncbi:LtrD [Enterococcus plantarum]|uniref:LtrD n=1 Tax=Enterococcus plantarum TaxID=1077675 RepID=UPI00084D45A0|nr:LtrD [Enterococcus plantarum]OEG18038.1 LtrD [Enterococcus plantarum]